MSESIPAGFFKTTQEPEIGSAAVRRTSEFRRVTELPQRDAEALGLEIAEPLSEMFRVKGAARTLRPLQAVAVAEAADLEGALVILPVGFGKTDVTFLLPTALDSKCALLLVPGKLLEKTKRDFAELTQSWIAPKRLAVHSYEKVSTAPELINELAPDLIIADECHRLKSRTAGCTKRVARYIHANPETRFIGLSGTLTKRSFMDWWHLQLWALPEALLVLPGHYKEAEAWAEALDERPMRRRPLGALLWFGQNLDAARRGYGERLRKTPGVIAANSSEIGTSLEIRRRSLTFDSIDNAIDHVTSTWSTPGGQEFCEAVELWSTCCEVSQGFYYKWKHEPPREWLSIRSAASSFIRKKLSRSRSLDTPAQVEKDCSGEPIMRQWAAIKNTFKPELEPVWFNNEVVDAAATWAYENDGLVWCISRAFGEALERRGIPFFCSNGKTGAGLHIYDYDGPAAVSVSAMSEGFNLQRYNTNLVPAAPSTGTIWEQMLGRTHRPGQLADEVVCEVWWTSQWTEQNFKTALNDAEYIERITGQRQKLNFADKTGVSNGK